MTVERDSDTLLRAACVCVFQDPYLVEVQDICEDPKIIRDEVNRYERTKHDPRDNRIAPQEDVLAHPFFVCVHARRLNREVVQGFVGLVKDLVHRPVDNKYVLPALCFALFRLVLHTGILTTRAFHQKTSRRTVTLHLPHAARMQQVSGTSSAGASH